MKCINKNVDIKIVFYNNMKSNNTKNDVTFRRKLDVKKINVKFLSIKINISVRKSRNVLSTSIRLRYNASC